MHAKPHEFRRVFDQTPSERAAEYHRLAKEAEDIAAATPLPAVRAAYLRSAERWSRLAATLEVGLRPGCVILSTKRLRKAVVEAEQFTEIIADIRGADAERPSSPQTTEARKA